MDNNNGKSAEITEKCNAIDQNTKRKTNFENQKSHLLYVISCVSCVLIAILIHFLNRYIPETKAKCIQPKIYWTYNLNQSEESRNITLKNVHSVLKTYGFQHSSTNETTWNLLWSHSYPFSSLQPHLSKLKPYQKVNHIPGTGYITKKVDFATTDSKYIPKAFKLPNHKQEFLKYAKENPNAVFLEKHNDHRGIRLKNVSEFDTVSENSFVQEYLQKPYLVDGYKFDIGVYVVITAIDPLRAYWYKGDVLFRYCPNKYYPLDPKDLDKYLIRDDYRPTSQVPSLATLFKTYQFGMKDSFDVYLQRQGHDPSLVWDEVQRAIADVLIKKEPLVAKALKGYPSKNNFFELIRVDLVLDEELKVYVIEANMSPNLNSDKFKENKPLYENMLHSLFSITGVAGYRNDAFLDKSEIKEAEETMTMKKRIAVNGLQCLEDCKDTCDGLCALCYVCLDKRMKADLLRAHTEYLRRGDFRRIFPPAMKPGDSYEDKIKGLSETNKLQYVWYQSKCNIDVTYCT